MVDTILMQTGETTAVYHKSDMGNTRRFAERFTEELRFVHGRNQWLVWDKTRWNPDRTARIMAYAKQCVREMYHSADKGAFISEKDANWALQCQNREKLNAMIALAQSEPEFSTEPAALDADAWLLNCQNCTIDLHTMQPKPHDKADLITRRVNVDYDPDAQCPTWDRFLKRIFAGDEELIAYVQRAVGYTLTGIVADHALFFLFGTGRNGKSTFIEVLMELLKEYSTKLLTETLMKKDSGDNVANSDIAALQGIRLCVTEETEQDRKMNESLVKKLTGGDMIRARFLYGEPFDFMPTHKLWMFGNHKPTIRGTDVGIWKRIKLIPFTVTIPDSEQDPYLKDKLRAELPGILNWALEGLTYWKGQGIGSCRAVDSATAEYKADMDIISDWISTYYTRDPKGWTLASDLFSTYSQYCKDNGERAISQKRLAVILKERGFEQGRATGGARVWKGLNPVDRNPIHSNSPF